MDLKKYHEQIDKSIDLLCVKENCFDKHFSGTDMYFYKLQNQWIEALKYIIDSFKYLHSGSIITAFAPFEAENESLALSQILVYGMKSTQHNYIGLHPNSDSIEDLHNFEQYLEAKISFYEDLKNDEDFIQVLKPIIKDEINIYFLTLKGNLLDLLFKSKIQSKSTHDLSRLLKDMKRIHKEVNDWVPHFLMVQSEISNIVKRKPEIQNLKNMYSNFKNWLGESNQIYEVMKATLGRKKDEKPVIICGKSGTGKELIFEFIAQDFNENNRVRVNCDGLNDELYRNELFGYVKGAFTGASKLTVGLFHKADNGVFFFDEFDKLDIAKQTVLLRPIQFNKIMRIGGKEEEPVKIRYLFATQKSKNSLINADQSNHFLPDLIHRLNPYLTIELPSLNDREFDAMWIVVDLLKDIEARVLPITPMALALLGTFQYRNNVRDVCNLIDTIKIRRKIEHIDIIDILFIEKVVQDFDDMNSESIDFNNFIVANQIIGIVEKELSESSTNETESDTGNFIDYDVVFYDKRRGPPESLSEEEVKVRFECIEACRNDSGEVDYTNAGKLYTNKFNKTMNRSNIEKWHKKITKLERMFN